MFWINRLAWLDKSYGVYNSTYVRWEILSWHPCSNLVHGNFVPVISLWKKYKLQSICLFNHYCWNINKKTGLKFYQWTRLKKVPILPLPLSTLMYHFNGGNGLHKVHLKTCFVCTRGHSIFPFQFPLHCLHKQHFCNHATFTAIL